MDSPSEFTRGEPFGGARPTQGAGGHVKAGFSRARWVALAAVALGSACAPKPFRAPKGFAPRAADRPDIGLVLLVEGAVEKKDLDELYTGFETGVVQSFTARGYRPVLLERFASFVEADDVNGEAMDRRDKVLSERSTFERSALARNLPNFVVVHLVVEYVRAPSDAPNVTLGTNALQGYANYHGWSTLVSGSTASEQPLFFSEMQSDTNWMPIVHSMNGARSHGAWFSYPTKVWARSLGRRLFRELPMRTQLRPERVSPEGLRVPAPSGHVVVPGLRRDLASDLPGKDTEFRNYQDARGNGFSVLVTNGVTWGWEVIPRMGDAYLLVDPSCSFRPTEIWPTTAEAPVPVPACVLRTVPSRFP